MTKRVRMELMVNSEKEYMVGLRYIFTKNIGIRVHYYSDMGLGACLSLNY
jgi:hypothetical protein